MCEKTKKPCSEHQTGIHKYTTHQCCLLHHCVTMSGQNELLNFVVTALKPGCIIQVSSAIISMASELTTAQSCKSCHGMVCMFYTYYAIYCWKWILTSKQILLTKMFIKCVFFSCYLRGYKMNIPVCMLFSSQYVLIFDSLLD